MMNTFTKGCFRKSRLWKNWDRISLFSWRMYLKLAIIIILFKSVVIQGILEGIWKIKKLWRKRKLLGYWRTFYRVLLSCWSMGLFIEIWNQKTCWFIRVFIKLQILVSLDKLITSIKASWPLQSGRLYTCRRRFSGMRSIRLKAVNLNVKIY